MPTIEQWKELYTDSRYEIMHLEAQVNRLQEELDILKKDAGFLCSRICYSSDFRAPEDVYEAACRIIKATKVTNG